MIKDIPQYTVEGVSVAVIKELNKQGEQEWNVYLVNLKEDKIEGVLVTSTGYGQLEGETRKTTTLRHFLDEVKPKSFAKIEPIVEDVFGMNNEYWVSFYLNKVMYDKRYIFLPETIREENFTLVPVINKKGILIG